MPDNVISRSWDGNPPWHDLGQAVSNKQTPAQMCKAANLLWPVEKRELVFVGKNGHHVKFPGKFALVRVPDDRPLSIIGATWKPVQNEAAVDFFKKFAMAGHMKMETLGNLHGGQYIWALARIGADFKLSGGDEIRGLILLSQPHVFGKALLIQLTPIRVVNWSTLTWALGTDVKTGRLGHQFRMSHSIEFNDKVRQQAEAASSLAKEQMLVFKECAELLAKTKAKSDDVEEYFQKVLRFNPQDAIKKKGKSRRHQSDVIEPRVLPRLRENYQTGPGADLKSAKGTWWGAVNAVTFTIDHQLGRDESAALRTAWFGAKAGLKRRAINLALDHVKAA